MNSLFEDWRGDGQPFDLVFAAQSFHFVDPEVGYSRAAELLRPGGALALFWNRSDEVDPGLRDALDEQYRKHAPEIHQATHARPAQFSRPGVAEGIVACGAFGPVHELRYPWSEVYDAERYSRLIRTYSDHITLRGTPSTRSWRESPGSSSPAGARFGSTM